MRFNLQSLLQNGDTGDLVGGWGGGQAAEGTSYPYLTWNNAFSDFHNELATGQPCGIGRTFFVNVYSKNFAFLRSVERAIIDDVADYGYIDDSSDGYDSEAKCYYLEVRLRIFDN